MGGSMLSGLFHFKESDHNQFVSRKIKVSENSHCDSYG